MFGIWRWPERDRPQEHDERLRAVLREWRAIEPGDGFEAAVWRRVHAVPAPASAAWALGTIRRLPFRAPPLWATALAATVAILLGVLAGLTLPETRAGRAATAPLLDAQTLAGAYVDMATGATR